MGQEIIRTDNVLVRVMELAKDAATDWHYHTEVKDYFVCLTGAVRIETDTSAEPVVLLPGQQAEVNPPQAHRVINIHADKSEYLLVQGVGTYDFIRL